MALEIDNRHPAWDVFLEVAGNTPPPPDVQDKVTRIFELTTIVFELLLDRDPQVPRPDRKDSMISHGRVAETTTPCGLPATIGGVAAKLTIRKQEIEYYRTGAPTESTVPPHHPGYEGLHEGLPGLPGLVNFDRAETEYTVLAQTGRGDIGVAKLVGAAVDVDGQPVTRCVGILDSGLWISTAITIDEDGKYELSDGSNFEAAAQGTETLLTEMRSEADAIPRAETSPEQPVATRRPPVEPSLLHAVHNTGT